ncbi:MAG: excinuclease ABC subunit UvrC [Bacilli bacterium]|jgi:excinuclease ABC subunit C
MLSDLLKEKLALLKPLPGCYLMKNKDDQIIYVGKAKFLDKRVKSYFNRPHNGKTAKMVREIFTFETIITSTEKEALLLEINLIHTYNPPYNILLKDDKAYPYIQLKLDTHPYLGIARRIKDKNSKYYGPYPEGKAARSTLNLLNRIFPLRKCRSLPKKPCLYYHIGQCLAPCINKIAEETYQELIQKIQRFMQGDSKDIRDELVKKMQECSEALAFERAKEYKEIIEGIDHITSQQNVQTNNKIDKDVIAFHSKDGDLAISILCFRSGILKLKHSEVVSCYGEVENQFISYLMQYYEKELKPQLLIMPKLSDAPLLSEVLELKIIAPSRGNNLVLLQMAAQNAISAMEEKHLNSKQDLRVLAVLDELGKRLNIKTPYRIELIDNSHYQGDAAVSAVVVFINGLPAKRLYRKYKINNEETRDDAASMYEVIYRRYYRLLSEKGKLSDLLIVDGGPSQILAAKKALSSLNYDLPVVGLVKDSKHQTSALMQADGLLINIQDLPELFFLLSRMQDEVHRFALSYHHDRRSKDLFKSELDGIAGLGKVRKQALLKAFGSVSKIAEASLEELLQYVPKAVAIAIKDKIG